MQPVGNMSGPPAAAAELWSRGRGHLESFRWKHECWASFLASQPRAVTQGSDLSGKCLERKWDNCLCVLFGPVSWLSSYPLSSQEPDRAITGVLMPACTYLAAQPGPHGPPWCAGGCAVSPPPLHIVAAPCWLHCHPSLVPPQSPVHVLLGIPAPPPPPPESLPGYGPLTLRPFNLFCVFLSPPSLGMSFSGSCDKSQMGLCNS